MLGLLAKGPPFSPLILRGAEVGITPAEADAILQQHLSNYTIIPVDQPLCRKWAQVRSIHQAIGRPLSAQDAWVAATALRYDLPFVTHNIKDFQDIPDLQLLLLPS